MFRSGADEQGGKVHTPFHAKEAGLLSTAHLSGYAQVNVTYHIQTKKF